MVACPPGVKPFQRICTNKYIAPKPTYTGSWHNTSKCECTHDPTEPNQPTCGDAKCHNRGMLVECDKNNCPEPTYCKNRRIQKRQWKKVKILSSGQKGHGLYSQEAIVRGEFVHEYVGEVIDEHEQERRLQEAEAQQSEPHYYIIKLDRNMYIDASRAGNDSRFMNHSCDPNLQAEKWTVGATKRIAFFARKSIEVGDELTFDYNWEPMGTKKQRCFCGAPNCCEFLGQKKKVLGPRRLKPRPLAPREAKLLTRPQQRTEAVRGLAMTLMPQAKNPPAQWKVPRMSKKGPVIQPVCLKSMLTRARSLSTTQMKGLIGPEATEMLSKTPKGADGLEALEAAAPHIRSFREEATTLDPPEPHKRDPRPASECVFRHPTVAEASPHLLPGEDPFESLRNPKYKRPAPSETTGKPMNLYPMQRTPLVSASVLALGGGARRKSCTPTNLAPLPPSPPTSSLEASRGAENRAETPVAKLWDSPRPAVGGGASRQRPPEASVEPPLSSSLMALGGATKPLVCRAPSLPGLDFPTLPISKPLPFESTSPTALYAPLLPGLDDFGEPSPPPSPQPPKHRKTLRSLFPRGSKGKKQLFGRLEKTTIVTLSPTPPPPKGVPSPPPSPPPPPPPPPEAPPVPSSSAALALTSLDPAPAKRKPATASRPRPTVVSPKTTGRASTAFKSKKAKSGPKAKVKKSRPTPKAKKSMPSPKAPNSKPKKKATQTPKKKPVAKKPVKKNRLPKKLKRKASPEPHPKTPPKKRMRTLTLPSRTPTSPVLGTPPRTPQSPASPMPEEVPVISAEKRRLEGFAREDCAFMFKFQQHRKFFTGPNPSQDFDPFEFLQVTPEEWKNTPSISQLLSGERVLKPAKGADNPALYRKMKALAKRMRSRFTTVPTVTAPSPSAPIPSATGWISSQPHGSTLRYNALQRQRPPNTNNVIPNRGYHAGEQSRTRQIPQPLRPQSSWKRPRQEKLGQDPRLRGTQQVSQSVLRIPRLGQHGQKTVSWQTHLRQPQTNAGHQYLQTNTSPMVSHNQNGARAPGRPGGERFPGLRR